MKSTTIAEAAKRLTNDWKSAQEIGVHGRVLNGLVWRGLAQRKPAFDAWLYRKAGKQP